MLIFASKSVIITLSIFLLVYTALMIYIHISLNNTKLNSFKYVHTELIDVPVQPAALYKTYLKNFNKSYGNEEMLRRFETFKNSLKEINRLNNKRGARYGLTKFSDMSPEQDFISVDDTLSKGIFWYEGSWTQNLGGNKLNKTFLQDSVLPTKFDWRDQGVVAPVINQLHCNGCWAFSIVGLMESMTAINKREKVERLSIQEVIDCSRFNSGCNGGNVLSALQWLCSNEWGVVPEEEYPLLLVDEPCKYEINEGRSLEGKRIKWFRQDDFFGNEKAILRLIRWHGPVAAVVNAQPWFNYIDGVIQRSCYRSKDKETLEHVVQIVGYDLGAPVPYYIIRNSWGDDFGIQGYVKLKIGNNLCGVEETIFHLDVY